jgi:hypothetical protein
LAIGFVLAADASEKYLPAVDRDLDLVRVLETANHVEVVAQEADVELVLAVEGEHVRHGHAADGAERQAVHLRRLRFIALDHVRLGAGHRRRVADG